MAVAACDRRLTPRGVMSSASPMQGQGLVAPVCDNDSTRAFARCSVPRRPPPCGHDSASLPGLFPITLCGNEIHQGLEWSLAMLQIVPRHGTAKLRVFLDRKSATV